MGSVQSTIRRRVQPALPYSSHYSRLSPSSPNSEKQSLLNMHEFDCLEQHKTSMTAVEEIRKINASLENGLHETRMKVETLESRFSKDWATKERRTMELETICKRNVILEKEFNEFRLKIERLELLASSKDSILKKQDSALETIRGRNAALERNIKELQAKVDGLEFMSQNVSHELDLSRVAFEPAGISKAHMNDLMGSLVVLMFLISMIIGMRL